MRAGAEDKSNTNPGRKASRDFTDLLFTDGGPNQAMHNFGTISLFYFDDIEQRPLFSVAHSIISKLKIFAFSPSLIFS